MEPVTSGGGVCTLHALVQAPLGQGPPLPPPSITIPQSNSSRARIDFVGTRGKHEVMPRLVDYVVLVGYDFKRSSSGESQGIILQRFPTRSWEDYPYKFCVEAFCQPCGWRLSQTRLPPSFFVAYLTDELSDPYFAACLTFYEAVTSEQLALSERSKLTGANCARLTSSLVNVLNGGTHSRSRAVRSSLISNSFHSSESLSSLGGRSGEGVGSTLHSVQDCTDPNLVRPAEFYAPKCLVLLARHQHFDVLKNSLSLLYTVFADSVQDCSLGRMIATLLGAVEVPPCGGPRITFTLGVGDRQTIQPARCSTIPITRNYVALLFRHLGVHNVILLFSAMLSDQKVLLCSRSLNRLTECGHALTSLLYPLKYSHTFVPILPKVLIEYLNAPIPFLYGIHSSYKDLVPDLPDVFVVDLDGGSVACPENISVPQLPEPYFKEVVDSLFHVLTPELFTSDQVYPPKPEIISPDLLFQDKQLRAIFIRLFASLFSGYRSCLNITRIHPQPVIHFNQSMFLMLRAISSHNEFFERLLSSLRFQQFILERGPPFRVCDIFDEVYDTAEPSSHQVLGTWSHFDGELDIEDCSSLPTAERLSQKLLENECGERSVEHVLPNQAVEAHKRLHQSPFPTLDARLVEKMITEATEKRNKSVQYPKPEPRFVPQGQNLDRRLFKAEMFPDKTRVLREFVADIFNQHITEALKRRNTIRQDLRSRPIRRLFVDELQVYLTPTTSQSPTDAIKNLAKSPDHIPYEERALLNGEQFELVVDLLDEALSQENRSEDSGISSVVLDLCTKFSTKLNNVRYYANMTHQIQRHAIWGKMSFWESLFNEHVNSQIRQLYQHCSKQSIQSQRASAAVVAESNRTGSSGADGSETAGRRGSCSSQTLSSNGERIILIKESTEAPFQQPMYTSSMSALEIAAEEMRVGHLRSKNAQLTLESLEENTVYAQIIHFVNLIVNFRIPVDIGAEAADFYGDPNSMNAIENHLDFPTNAGESIPNGLYHHSRSNGPYHERGTGDSKKSAGDMHNHEFQDYTTERYGQKHGRADDVVNVTSALNYISNLENWLRRFVDKVVEENNIVEGYKKKVNEKIEGIIEGHLLNLKSVYPEVKNIPKTKKPEIASPTLLPEEITIPIAGMECIPCQLLLDGRLERTDWQWLDTSSDLNANGQNSGLSERSGGSTGNVGTENEVEFDTMLHPLLPAQGAVFITNYRFIFTGFPKDPYQSNKVVIRSFPVAALHSVKKLGIIRTTTVFPATTSAQPNVYTTSERTATIFTGKRSRGLSAVGSRHKHRGQKNSLELSSRKGFVRIDENLYVLSIRALSMQLLRLGFDPDEVPSDTREELQNLLVQLRYPTALRLGFNLSTVDMSMTTRSRQNMDPRLSPTTAPASRERSWTYVPDDYVPDTEPRLSRTSRINDDVTSATLTEIGSSFSKPLSPIFRLADEAAAAITTVLTSAGVPKLEPKLLSIFVNSPGYLDMARFALGSYSSSKSSSINTGASSSGRSTEGSSGGGCSGIGAVVQSGSDVLPTGARLVAFNVHYEVTRSYPPLLVVPQSISQSCLSKVARFYRHGRFPVVTWQHPGTGAYLLRGSGFSSKPIVGALKYVGSSGPSINPISDKDGSGESGEHSGSHVSSSKEHARYLLALVDMAFGAMSAVGSVSRLQDNFPSDVDISSKDEEPGSMNNSTIASPASEHATLNKRTPDNLTVSNSLQMCGNKARSLGRLTGLTLRHAHGEATPMGSTVSGLDVDDVSSSNINFRSTSPKIGSTSTKGHRVVTLYVLGERSAMKDITKHSSFQSVEFVPIDFVSQSAISKSFKELFKACFPADVSKLHAAHKFLTAATNAAGITSAPPVQTNLQDTDANDLGSVTPGSATPTVSSTMSGTASTIHTAIFDCGWLSQVQSVLQLAGAVVYLLDIKGVSVALCLENGYDAVTQTITLAQIMMDPDYRTIAGFCALIEKEWLMFGHPFSQRLHQISPSKSDPISPVFLQFLDAVHQLLRQFPLSFEFNDFFLQFLAYHHMSNRFHNFKYDCEFDRLTTWFNGSEVPPSKLRTNDSVCLRIDENLLQKHQSHSIWSYIQQQHDEWPVFFNFRYSRQMGEKVLHPATNMASLDIWQFYLSEDLATGPVYDLDHFSPSYRKHTKCPYEPVLREGFNNSHIEKVYAVLGLREGEEATGWRKAWEQAQAELGERVISRAARGHQYQGRDLGAKTITITRILNPDGPSVSKNGRQGSEPLTRGEEDAYFSAPPRRAISTSVSENNTDTATDTVPRSLVISNQTTLTPQGYQASGFSEARVASSASSELEEALTSRAKTEDLKPSKMDFGINDGRMLRINVRLPDLRTGGLRSDRLHTESEDEGLEAYADHDGSSLDDDSLDDCFAARSAALCDHRVTTLRRLSRRNASKSHARVYPQTSLETGLGSGLGYESDSVTSGSLCSANRSQISFAGNSDEATSNFMFTNPHNFVPTSVIMPNVRCQLCSNFFLFLGAGRTAARCTNCSYLCHEKCAPLVPKQCRTEYSVSAGSGSFDTARVMDYNSRVSLRRHFSGLTADDDQSRSVGFLSPRPPWRNNRVSCHSIDPSVRNSVNAAHDKKPQRESPAFEHCSLDRRTAQSEHTPTDLTNAYFHGLLYKMGHRKLLQQWKQRFFVLDTSRHQLRYYDTPADEVPRGCIDLQDVRAVRLVKNIGLQRRVSECGVFELETGTRIYRFASEPPEKAGEWVDRIQNTIQ
ncbi:unnamed protein product [Calicophoron daubneyi]|uniref:Myotubularin-related protein 13 n=1 Tax=Calicophoron daubneyi TaxID=300641 RepID=A0AAV2TS01_CALDB